MKYLYIVVSFIVVLFTNQEISAQTPTWLNVAPIIYKNCTPCHNTGGIAPFSLVGFTNCKNRSSSIASSVVSKIMPPWPADPKYKRYAHERILSAQEIDKLVQWANLDAPYGDTTLNIPDPISNQSTQLTNPSITLKMPNYMVNTINDEYRCFVLPTNLAQDQFATALEVIPGNRSIVHHVLVFQDTSGIPTQKDLADPNPGYLAFGGTGSPSSQLIGVYVPGQEPFVFPTGFGTKILKNSKIIIQIHYPKGITYCMDSTKVALELSSASLRQVYISPILNHNPSNMTNGPLYIPANQIKTFYTKYYVGQKATVFACAPHMHLIGTQIKAYGLNSSGDTQKIISIPNWDFHWQRTYTFFNPQIIQSGTTLWAEGVYDNTSNNINNPNSPPIGVSKGEGTTDEMMLVYFWYTGYQAGDENIVLDTLPLKNLSSVVIPIKNRIQITPNPITNEIHFEGQILVDKMVLYNLEGQKIDEYQLNKQEIGEIKIKYQPTGMYILELISENSRVKKKIFITQE